MYGFCQLYKLIITIKNYLTVLFPLNPETALHLSIELSICQRSLYTEAEASGQCGNGCTCPPLALPKNLLLSTSDVFPWRAPSPGLVLLPSLLLSSETGVMCGFWSMIPIPGWELESPLQTVNMFLSAFHRMY